MLTTHIEERSPAHVGTAEWMNVCPVDRLIEGRGVCVKVDGRAIAVFLVGDRLFAIDNTDPFSGASVLSRGLVGVVRGDAGLVHYVASPLRKQRFCLETGRCLDDDTRSVQTHEVAVIDGAVILRSDAHRAITAVKPR